MISLPTFGFLCFGTGFLLAAVIAAILYITKPKPFDASKYWPKKEWQIIPAGTYVMRDDRVFRIEELAQ